MEISLHSQDDRKARIAAFIFAIILIFLILYPFWTYTFPLPEKEGILVSFGQIEIVGGDDVKESQISEVETASSEESNETQSQVFQKSEASSKKAEPKAVEVKIKVATELESVLAVKEKESPKSPSAEDRRQEAEAKKAAEEAKKKAEFQKAKKQFGDLLGKGKGSGDATGDAGDPSGDPSADVLKGLSKGKGKIQGGLSDRGLLNEPEIEENSQKAGIVVVRVCVDNRGKVIDASYTQRGSTTTDSDLVKAAIDGSKKYQFSKSPIEKQCGTITIEFKLK